MMQNELSNLLRLTANCREDMHEPDEQDVTVRKWKGIYLDNAFGASPDSRERCFLLRNGTTGEELWVNLASLIALARKAKL
jgi:hypothetical protein